MKRHAVFLLLILLFLPFSAHAQFALPGTGSGLTLSSTPEYPRAGDTVRFSVRSTLLSLSESAITWYANGIVIAEGVGLSETTVVAGSLGSETIVRVEVRTQDAIMSTSGALRPTEVDLLWEADSYVPPFYRGRALPSAGSDVLFFVSPRFVQPATGARISPNQLVYTWRKNGQRIQSASGLGKHFVRLAGPVLFGSDTISVDVTSQDGELRGSSSARISSIEPILALYEDHPIFGTLYHKQLPQDAAVPEIEATLSVVPYFAPISTPDSGALVYDWRVNGSEIESSANRPSSITLNAEGSSGVALIELTVTHVTNFFLSASRAWRVTLGGSGEPGFFNPFGSSGQ